MSEEEIRKETPEAETPAPEQEAPAAEPETEQTEPVQEEEKPVEEEKETEKDGKEKRGFFTARKMNSEIEKTKKKLSETEKELEKVSREKDEYLQLLQRNQADFENFRRRNANVRSESIDTGRREVLTEILPVVDDLERVVANPGNADAAFAEGVQLVYKKLMATLQKLGLEPLEESGKFDPNLHNAVLSEKVEGAESETILAVLQKGYKVGDRIIRHSMVKVAE